MRFCKCPLDINTGLTSKVVVVVVVVVEIHG